MKLTVYDQMTATPIPPLPSQLSKMMNQGRVLASKASGRVSFSIRKRSSSRPIISDPQAVVKRIPSNRWYRPLELSIYAPQNRLSDLPEFDSEAVNFADDGAIQLPPKALVRAKSSEELRRTPSQRTPNKSKSMIEPALLHRRTDTASTVISTSRPPSNYDALHSHPVSWIEGSLPGLPPPCHHRIPTAAATILSPMQEEFSPACTPACITIDGTTLEFPRADPEPRPTSPGHEPAPAPPLIVSTAVSKTIAVAPFKLSPPPTSASAKPFSPLQYQESPTLPASHHGSPSMSSVYSYSTTSTKTSPRISNWLSHQRGPSSAASVSTTRSFAEHRRKRSEFYQVRIPKVPSQVTSATSPTPSTRIPFQQQFKHQRQRTMSGSTIGSASTVSTDIMSLDGPNDSMTTMSTNHVVQDVRSNSRARSETMRSFSKPIVVVQEEEIPNVPFAVQAPSAEDMYLKEIGGPLRSPGVGLAF